MALFLGIDGGGTGCRAAVADASGRILGEGRAGPANIASDLGGARANILAAATEALTAACGAALVAQMLPTLSAGFGLAGANAAGVVDRLRNGLPFARLRVETDAMAAVKGALQGRDGIVAALGTGSVFARQTGSTIRQIGGWGLVLGDEGSGAWLGRGALRLALRAKEGFVPETPFLRQISDEHGGNEGIIAFSLSARPADFAALVPAILATDDPAMRDLLAQATRDVAAFIARLQTDPTLPVTFIGGLGPTYAERLAGRWTVAPALGSALDGALILAREAA
ncbi:MAG: ATPase [Rhodobacterales bacterium]|nr:ATPase [Rhodobacterales bacterium]